MVNTKARTNTTDKQVSMFICPSFLALFVCVHPIAYFGSNAIVPEAGTNIFVSGLFCRIYCSLLVIYRSFLYLSNMCKCAKTRF